MNEVAPLIASLKEGGSVNLLLQGSAGCGKTTLATLIAKRIDKYYCFQIPDKGKINISWIKKKRVNFIDEIHELRHHEPLYPYMDSKEKVFLFCTTEYGNVPDPFLTRCIRLTFEPYSIKELAKIAKDYSQRRRFILKDTESYLLLAEASRGSPRLVKQRFDRVKMMLTYYGYPSTFEYVHEVLNQLGIHDEGYTREDVRYLTFLRDIEISSLTNLSRALQIDRNTLMKEIEPWLIENGNIAITPRGRKFLKWPLTLIQHV